MSVEVLLAFAALAFMVLAYTVYQTGHRPAATAPGQIVFVPQDSRMALEGTLDQSSRRAPGGGPAPEEPQADALIRAVVAALEARDRIDLELLAARVAEIVQAAPRPVHVGGCARHAWALASAEETNGVRRRIYVCTKCPDRLIEDGPRIGTGAAA